MRRGFAASDSFISYTQFGLDLVQGQPAFLFTCFNAFLSFF